MRHSRLKPVTALIGAALVTTLSAGAMADSGADPFGLNAMPPAPQMLADHHSGGGEGTCGEGKCGEGKCGGGADDEAEETQAGEGACGEGKCGEGKCGASDGDEATG